ncbi:hypothetical protein ACSVDA_05550 [Cytobacillus sp. Hm23]
MKKIAVLLVAIVSIVNLFPQSSVQAAEYSKWWSIDGIPGCEVRVVTDKSDYYSGSINVYAQTNGECGKLYYQMELYDVSYDWDHSYSPKGYFTSQTPTKSFSVSEIPVGLEPLDVFVEIDLYENSDYTGFLDNARSNLVTVH